MRRPDTQKPPVRLAGAIVFAIASFVLPSCVISDDGCFVTTIAARFDDDGLEVYIELGRPVRLPLDEDDALYIMQASSCACTGPLTLNGDYWEYSGDAQGTPCSLRIHVYTGALACSSGTPP